MTLASQRYFLLVALAGAVLLGCTDGAGPKTSAPKAGCPADCPHATDPADETETPTAEGENTPETVASLTASLADPSAEVRARAAQKLGTMGELAKPAAAELTSLLKDEDPTVRRQAVSALGAIQPGPEVMLPLFAKLLQDSDPGVQLRVLNAVAETGEAAVPGLIKALDNDEVSYWACIVLRDIGPAAKDAVPALTEKLKDPREEIRMQAVLALGAIGEAAASAVPQIAAALEDEHVAPAATFVLGELGTIPADAEPTIRANTKSERPGLRAVSYWALARVNLDDMELRREAVVELVARLKDENPQVRQVAARALAALPPAPELVIPIWEEAMKDADAKTVYHALDALATLGEPAVPRMVGLLETHDQLRVEVTYVLGQMGPAAAPATDALAKLVADEDLQLATEAALALGKIGPAAKDAVPALIAALEAEGEKNAHAIILALGKIGPGAAAAEPMVLKAMESEDKALAVIAAGTFMDIQSTASPEAAAKAVPVLVAGLGDPLPETRIAAADGLAALGALASEAVPALKKASGDSVEAVREAATDALKAIQ